MNELKAYRVWDVYIRWSLDQCPVPLLLDGQGGRDS